MKFYNKKLLWAVVCAFAILSVNVAASAKLSPALDILKAKLEIKKCTTDTGTLEFSASDFEDALNTSLPDFVTISSLPDSSMGVLTISGTRVLENQTISRKSLDLLCFEPQKGVFGQTDFTFSDGFDSSASQIKCTVNVLSQLNLSPSASDSEINTAKNISVYSSLKANDPEGDELYYEIVSYPKKGNIKITDTATGSFVYTPANGKKGKDSFTFKVTDLYGNVSQTAKVSAFIENKVYKNSLDDMDDHWGKLAASKICETGLMTTSLVDGKNMFNPDGTISRGDFLAMAMIVTDNEKNVELCYTTTFADDSLIPANIKSYAESALAMGIISGYEGEENSGQVCFASENPITVSEAAVILQRLSKAPKPIINPKIKDIDLVPTWAKDSIYSLMSSGIINGNAFGEINAEGFLTRARAAQMLCNAMEYTEEKAKQEKPKRNIFNLFGLLDD